MVSNDWTVCLQGVTLQEVEVPSLIRDTDVLIKVKAASLDPVDLKVITVDMISMENISSVYSLTEGVSRFRTRITRSRQQIQSQCEHKQLPRHPGPRWERSDIRGWP